MTSTLGQFLPKPFQLAQMLGIVASLLDFDEE
jgi:hypothetical protein